ncbi:MAG: HAMP domain-containing histidine kinase [Campylobacterales bacterium]|nr:HAMP domain-containing histidine kinase [Campylobacterales bacterium]
MFQNIAHHWRQPLNTIALSSEMILEKLEDINEECAKEVKTELDGIAKHVQFLSKTINIFSRYFNSSETQEVINIQQEIQQILLILKANFENNHINIIQNVEYSTIFGKKSFFANIIFILLNNAIESISKKIEQDSNFKGIIEINSEIKNSSIVKISISDNGIGVDNNIIKNVFEPYITTKFKAQDVGLSLFLAKLNVINDFNGKIYINKEKEDGAEFIIELPLHT